MTEEDKILKLLQVLMDRLGNIKLADVVTWAEVEANKESLRKEVLDFMEGQKDEEE